MAKKSAPTGRKLRGAQKWIVAELRSMGPSETLSTSKLAKRIAKSSGKRFHKNSVYNALRVLVSRGDLEVVRSGREKSYQLGSSARAVGPAPASSKAPAPRADLAPTETVTTETVTLAAVPAAASLPHKLGLGEILVLEIGEGYVLMATNLHGRLVVERQALPSK